MPLEDALALLPPDAKERPLKLAERPTDTTAAHRHAKPAFWSSKIHGVPRNAKPRRADTAIALRRPQKGAFAGGVSVARPIKPKPAGAALAKPANAALRKRVEDVTAELRRKVITEYTPFHEKESAILMRTFKAFDIENRRTVSAAAFQKVLAIFDIDADAKLCDAIFDKYGCDVQNRLPYDVFVRALFSSSYRLLAWTPIQQGIPFHSAGNALQRRDEEHFAGKIQQGNKRCITGVYTPHDWDGRAALARARRRPDAHLELEHVYGYAGNTKMANLKIDPQSSWLAPNIFFTSTREVVYFTAAVGVVLDWTEPSAPASPPPGAAASSRKGRPGRRADRGPAASAEELRQRFFQSHDDDVLCIALDESRNYCATGQKAPVKLRKGVQCSATVSVWDVHSMQELMELEHKAIAATDDQPASGPMAGVQAVSFNEDGTLLLSVCCNLLHTLHVWNWRKRQLLFVQNTRQGTPPSVWGVKWNPVELAGRPFPQRNKVCDFATWGVKHITFWETRYPNSPGKHAWAAGNGGFLGGDKEQGVTYEIQDVMCAEFLPGGEIITGMQSGDIYLWRESVKPADQSTVMRVDEATDGDGKAVKVEVPWDKPRTLAADEGGPILHVVWKFTVAAGPSKQVRPHKHNCMVLKLRSNGTELFSAGGEGQVKVWTVAPNATKAGGVLTCVGDFEVRSPFKHASKPLIKALDSFPSSDEIVIGTDKCDVWKVTLKRSGGRLVQTAGKNGAKVIDTEAIILVKGHADEVKGLDAHPTKEGLFATACRSDRVYLWDSTTRLELGMGELNVPSSSNEAVACAFSADGERLAVGTYDGAVVVFDLAKFAGGTLKLLRNDKGTLPLHDRSREISELKYSPNNKMLAVAGHDTMIEIFNTVGDAYTRLARCGGHSATVAHLDWSIDCRVLQSNCNARELLYWDVWWGYDDPADGEQPKRRVGMQCIDDQRDTRWATWSCNIGFEVMGIYPEGYATDDINMTARSRDGRYLAAADDRGGVILYNHPAVVDDGPHFWYSGHSSHVTNVKWLSEGDDVAPVIVSAGGFDRALFQWRVVEDVPPEKKPKKKALDEEPEVETAVPPALKGSAAAGEGAAAPPSPAADAASSSAKGAGVELRSASFLQQQSELSSQKATIQKQDDEIKALMGRLAELERSVKAGEVAKSAAGAAPSEPSNA